MTGNGVEEARIIGWLKAHPLDENATLDEFSIPEEIWRQVPLEPYEAELSGLIDGLSPDDQKLLCYLARSLPADAIIESMEFASPEEFWVRKSAVEEKLEGWQAGWPGTVAGIFEKRRVWAEKILELADVVDRENEKTRNRKRLKVSLFLSPFFLAACFLIFWPMLVKPDPAVLFERFRNAVPVDTALIDTTNYNGARWYQAMSDFYSDDPITSQILLQELIDEGTEYLTPARWFLSLTFLRRGNFRECRTQLELLKDEDPSFDKKTIRLLYKQLR
jgi:hypothetical protein